MEKYLVIVIMILLAYYLHNCWVENKIEKFLSMNKIKEGFADAQTIDGVDDNNAINTLAKIAKDLQEGGGLKVKGNLIVDNTIRVTGAKTTPAGSGDMMTHFNHENGNNYIRGNTYLSGNLSTGNLDVEGVTTVPVSVWHKSKDGKNRIHYENNGTSYYGSGNGQHIFRLGADGGGSEVKIDNQGTLYVSKINLGGIILSNENGLKVGGNLIMADNTNIVMNNTGCNGTYIQLKQSCGNNSIANDGNGRLYIVSNKMKNGEVIQHW